MFSSMTERIHQSSSSSKLKYPKYTLLSPNLMFIEASYSTVDFCQLSKVQSSHLDLFTCWICFSSKIVVAGNARRQCQTFLWCVYRHENGKNNTTTHRFVLLTHPPCMCGYGMIQNLMHHPKVWYPSWDGSNGSPTIPKIGPPNFEAALVPPEKLTWTDFIGDFDGFSHSLVRS